MIGLNKGKEGIVLYSSRTGYTKRYAEHIAKELGYTLKPIQKANLFNVSCYSTIIYGGGLHHNNIDGIKGITEGADYLGEQNLIIFSVGLSSVNDELAKQIKLKNMPESMAGTFFYHPLPGGLARKDTEPGGAVADKIEAYRKKSAEGKKLTRGDRIALAIANGEAPEQDRFDLKACEPILAAARRMR